MSTFMAKGETIERKWYVIDAAGKPLGRTAALAALILRGKHKPEFTPHVDCGDFVIIVNAGKAVLTGNKLRDKVHYTHSGYAGGLKETKYSKIMKERPQLAMRLAVKGMVQKSKVGRWSLNRLKVFAEGEHTHQAQKPEIWAGR